MDSIATHGLDLRLTDSIVTHGLGCDQVRLDLRLTELKVGRPNKINPRRSYGFTGAILATDHRLAFFGTSLSSKNFKMREDESI